MRIYNTFVEAQNEIKRDIAELGVKVQPETMQDIYVKDNPEFETRELANYIYTVTRPKYTEIDGVHEEWVMQEWQDRLAGNLNPGRSWRKRPEIWIQFMENAHMPERPGRFAYTYSQRMGGKHLQAIIDELIEHPHSRQLYLPVWDREKDWARRGKRRVPCSLGYWFVQRGNYLNLTYMMRSCDFMTHYANDIALAAIMQEYVAIETGYQPGTFTHFVGSLHAYKKDLGDVF